MSHQNVEPTSAIEVVCLFGRPITLSALSAVTCLFRTTSHGQKVQLTRKSHFLSIKEGYGFHAPY